MTGTIRQPVLVAALGAAVFSLMSVAPEASNRSAERALKDYFEGQRVIVRLDMPGTSNGVNVRVDDRRPIDYARYRDDLRRHGIAIRAGESAIVTLVKVKNDLIEFQLGGGGFGTFFDDADTTVHIPYIEKSEREKLLERRIREEKDRDRRRQLQRELDSLREWRARENRRIEIERARLSELKRQRVAYQRLNGGSRFNIRYRGRVPYDLHPEDIMAALADYVDFRDARGFPGFRRPFPR